MCPIECDMASLKHWIQAARLRTLPLAISGILVGTSIASTKVPIDFLVLGLTLLTAILLQVLSNFANDFGDAVSGVDSENRAGPKRMVQTGTISKTQMKYAMVLTATLSMASGCWLLYLAFENQWPQVLIFLFIGVGGIIAAIKYTIGNNPYGYAGFGDHFVFVFFGLVAVVGTYYLQTHSLDPSVFLPAISVGLFSVGVLNVNNIRDIASDRINGKKSIPVRIGKERAAWYHTWILSTGMATTVLFIIITFHSWLQLLVVISYFLLFGNMIAVRRKEGKALDPYLKHMALTTLLFAVLFAMGYILS